MRIFIFVSVVLSLGIVSRAQVPVDPGEPGIISGKVIDADGRPFVDAQVYVKRYNGAQIGTIKAAVTDAKGRFRIEHLRPGAYEVFAVPGEAQSMLTRWRKRVYLPSNDPVRTITIRIGVPKSKS